MASPTNAAFNSEVRKGLLEWERQKNSTLERIHRELRNYSNDVIAQFAGVTEWDAFRVQQVSRGVNAAKERFRQRISEELRLQATEATAMAIAGVDRPLIKIGAGKESLSGFVASDRQLVLVEKYIPSLISDATDDITSGVQNILRRAMLGNVDTKDLIRDIGIKIGKSPSSRGTGSVFDKGTRRLRTIFRTEANRIHNLAREQRIDELSEKFPGVGKKWIHRRSNSPRQNHVALNGKVVFPAKGEKFLVAGIRVDGPHDLALPASEVINCHCTVVATYDENAAVIEAPDPLITDRQTGMDLAKRGITNELR